jgi:hypothetical protein
MQEKARHSKTSFRWGETEWLNPVRDSCLIAKEHRQLSSRHTSIVLIVPTAGRES